MLIDVHTHTYELPAQGVSVCSLFAHEPIPDQGWFSIGMHPWHTADVHWRDSLTNIEKKARSENVLALGELGFDSLRGAPLAQQRLVAEAQVRLAEQLGKPVVLHCVRAWPDLLSLRKALHPRQPWLVHGFRGGVQLAQQLLRAGFFRVFWLCVGAFECIAGLHGTVAHRARAARNRRWALFYRAGVCCSCLGLGFAARCLGRGYDR